jgi:hypothetical protein
MDDFTQLARKLGLPWVNWLCLRRSHATWMAVYAGADVKSVSAQMRHSNIEMTMNTYAQTVPESQRRAVAQTEAMYAARTTKAEEVMTQPQPINAALSGTRWWTAWSSTAMRPLAQ